MSDAVSDSSVLYCGGPEFYSGFQPSSMRLVSFARLPAEHLLSMRNVHHDWDSDPLIRVCSIETVLQESDVGVLQRLRFGRSDGSEQPLASCIHFSGLGSELSSLREGFLVTSFLRDSDDDDDDDSDDCGVSSEQEMISDHLDPAWDSLYDENEVLERKKKRRRKEQQRVQLASIRTSRCSGMEVCDLQTGRQVVSLELPRIHLPRCMISISSRGIFTGSSDCVVRRWDFRDDLYEGGVVGEHTSPVIALASFPRNSNLLVSASAGGMGDNCKVWDLRCDYKNGPNRKLAVSDSRFFGRIAFGCVGCCGENHVFGASGGEICRWDLRSSGDWMCHWPALQHSCTCIEFASTTSPFPFWVGGDSGNIAKCLRNGKSDLRNGKTDQTLGTRIRGTTGERISGLQFRRDGIEILRITTLCYHDPDPASSFNSRVSVESNCRRVASLLELEEVCRPDFVIEFLNGSIRCWKSFIVPSPSQDTFSIPEGLIISEELFLRLLFGLAEVGEIPRREILSFYIVFRSLKMMDHVRALIPAVSRCGNAELQAISEKMVVFDDAKKRTRTSYVCRTEFALAVAKAMKLPGTLCSRVKCITEPSSFAELSRARFARLYLSRSHAPLVLRCESTPIRVHPEILMLRSDFFRTMFAFGGVETSELKDSATVSVDILSHAQMQLFVYLLYRLEWDGRLRDSISEIPGAADSAVGLLTHCEGCQETLFVNALALQLKRMLLRGRMSLGGFDIEDCGEAPVLCGSVELLLRRISRVLRNENRLD